MSAAAPFAPYLRSGLYLEKVHGKGRGLFCVDDIKAGEIIERVPVYIVTEPERESAMQTRVFDYVFSVHKLPEAALRRAGIVDLDKAAVFVPGAMSFCNHMRLPNAHEYAEDDGQTSYFVLEAQKDIPKATEITVDYGIGWLTKQRHYRASLRMLKRGDYEPPPERIR